MVGIDTCPDAPGYKRFLIHPCPGGRISHAGAVLETVRGSVSCKWTLQGETFSLDVVVPSNTTAEIHLPKFVRAVKEPCGLEFTENSGILSAQAHAGTYRIIC